MSNQWIVLRCANAQTLKLADSLNASGIEAWTPIATIIERKGKERHRVEKREALAKSYVFALADHFFDLLEMSTSLTLPTVEIDGEKTQMPGFWVFKYNNEYRAVPDRQLDGFRVAAQTAQPKSKAVKFQDGDFVRSTNPGFEGLPGKVEYTKGKFTFVLFGGLRVQIATTALLLVDGGNKQAA